MIQRRTLISLLLAATAAWAQNQPVLVDTDAGSDDLMALALLLAHPKVNIDSVTVVNGLAHVDAGARNIGRLLDLAGRKNVLVYAGPKTPMRGSAEFPAEWRKIADELPGVSLPPATRAPSTKPAVDFLVERLRNPASPVVILALGPLTNIAEALGRDGSIAAHISEIVLMGGAVRVPGNLQDGGLFRGKNTTAEWNIFIDPEAARIVFRSGIPVRLIALDATNTVKIGPEFVRDLKAKPLSPLGRIVAGVLEADREAVNQGIFYAWDPLAAAALLRPDIVTTAPMHIDVKLGAPEEGRTVATPGKPNTKVAVQADAARFLALFRESFSGTGVR